VLLGLLVFSMRYRAYVPTFRKVAAFSLFFYLPWILHVLPNASWLGTSSGAMGAKNAFEFVARGVVQLQIINPILLYLALRTWRRDTDEKLGAVKSLLVGFLPMLLTYGGRYFMHTWPLWAILAARSVERWIARATDTAELPAGAARPSLRRRVFVMTIVALLPLPVVTSGMPGGRLFGLMPGPTGANAALFVAIHRTKPDRDFERLTAFVVDVMEPWRNRVSGAPPTPDGPGGTATYERYLASPEYAALRTRIVHVGTDGPGDRMGSIYFGDRLVAATGCRVDTGGWGPEVRSELMLREVARARVEDPWCLFAFQKKGGFALEEVNALKVRHGLTWARQFGPDYLVGGRREAEGSDTF